jgi:hypothetical protein
MSAPVLNSWSVAYRFKDRPNIDWEVQCHFPAVEIIEWDGESQEGSLTPFIDIGQCRAYMEARNIEERLGSNRVETLVRFVHFPPFLVNGTREFTIIGRFDEHDAAAAPLRVRD